MEREQLDHEDYQQSRSSFIDNLATRLYEADQTVELANLNHLFYQIAHSLYEHGLVPADLSRRVATEDPDDGRTISRLDILTFRASEPILDEEMGGTDADWGDWGKFFSSQAEMTDYLGNVAGRFEDKFLDQVNKEEVFNG